MKFRGVLIKSLNTNWRLYLVEAWALGMFMVAATIIVVGMEHPSFYPRNAIDSAFIRRVFMGLAIGLTAILLIKSNWGKRSGAHMNPAVTLTFFQLDRINLADTFWYIVAQFVGGSFALALMSALLGPYLKNPAVNYIVTVPGTMGPMAALGLEMTMSFVLFLVVLVSSNSSRWAPYTPYFVGFLLLIFISFEAPFSGMSINPARSFASSANSGIWTSWWIYFLGPIAGMQLAGALYRRGYRFMNNDNCLTMKCHMSGENNDCGTYAVLGPNLKRN